MFAPSLVSELTMITGNGPPRQDRVQRRQAVHVRHLNVQRDHVRPQRVRISSACRPSPAVPTTLIPGVFAMLSAMIERITAESSTTSTRISGDRPNPKSSSGGPMGLRNNGPGSV